MPKTMPMEAGPGDEMEDLYAAGEPTKGEPESIDEEEAQDMAQTAVVPVKVLQSAKAEPVKEGDEIVVKVLKVDGDQAQIKYAPEKPGADEGGEPAGGAGGEKTPDEEIEALDNY